MNTELLMQIVLGLITIMGTILTSLIVPYIKNKTSKEQRESAMFWVEIAVKAAEQIFSEPKTGEEKKAYVIGFLEKAGIKITDDELDILIEAAVKELNVAKALIK